MILFFISFLILNFFLFNLIRKLCFKINLVDKPDGVKKKHLNIVPLGGGTILLLNIFLYGLFNYLFSNESIIFSSFQDQIIFFLGCLTIFIIGIIDDKLDLKPNTKFILLICSIIFFLFLSSEDKLNYFNFSFHNNRIDFSSFNIIVTTLCYICFLNSFNMFDGINLQSSIYSIICFVFFLILSTDTFFIIILIFLLIFSFYNYKNLIFLGDSGSLLISFVIGFIFIKLYNNNTIIYADQIFLIMSLPGIDMIRLFIIRIKNKKNPFKGDLNHIHHILTKKYSNKIYYLIVISLVLVPNLVFYFTTNFTLSFLIFLIPYLFLTFNKKTN